MRVAGGWCEVWQRYSPPSSTTTSDIRRFQFWKRNQFPVFASSKSLSSLSWSSLSSSSHPREGGPGKFHPGVRHIHGISHLWRNNSISVEKYFYISAEILHLWRNASNRRSIPVEKYFYICAEYGMYMNWFDFDLIDSPSFSSWTWWCHLIEVDVYFVSCKSLPLPCQSK